MSFDYTRLRATAKRLIARFGQDITVNRTTGGSHDPVLGEVTGGSDASFTVKGVVLNASRVFRQPADQQLIQGGDQAVYLEAGQTINNGEALTIDGAEWFVQELRPLSPAGTVVLYQALVRQ